MQAAEFCQVGVFPENASHWDWISEQIVAAGRQVHILNLFGYTGLATLAAARAGAWVTRVYASKKAVAGREEPGPLRPVRPPGTLDRGRCPDLHPA